MDRRIYGWTDGRFSEWTDKKMDSWVDPTDRITDGWMDKVSIYRQ